MIRVIRIDAKGSIQQLEPAYFANEVDELQSYINKNPTVLGDNIIIVDQQLDTGSGKRLDMLAVEEVSEGVVRPIVVELKNVEAGIDTLLQVLRYSDWVLSNTDLVRLRAEKSKAKFREFDNSSVKAIIVAPSIKTELVELSNYIVSSVDFGFLQFSRYNDAAGDIVVLDWKTPTVSSRSATVAQQEWDWGKYESELKIGSDRIRIAKYIFDGLVSLDSEKEWELTPFFRKYYIAFKKSGSNIVEIDLYTRLCYLVIRLPEPPTGLGLRPLHEELKQGYNEKYHHYWFQIDNTDLQISDFSEYIQKALDIKGLVSE